MNSEEKIGRILPGKIKKISRAELETSFIELKIVQLFLEKLEKLDPEERKTLLSFIRVKINTPLWIVEDEKK